MWREAPGKAGWYCYDLVRGLGMKIRLKLLDVKALRINLEIIMIESVTGQEVLYLNQTGG